MPESVTQTTSDMQVVWDSVVDPDTGESFSIVSNSQSGWYQTYPVPANLDDYYTASYHGNRHGFTAQYCDWRRSRIMSRALELGSDPNGVGKSPGSADVNAVRWLDLGCGDGTLLQRVAGGGWVVRGVERFPEGARRRGLTVFKSLEEAASDGPYDGVSLWHVLEHLPEPDQTVAAIRRVLKPNGVVLIAVPDASSLAARFFGPHWLHWDVPRHLFHFSPESLGRLLTRNGFRSQQLYASEFEYDLMGFAQSALNKMRLKHNMFFKIVTGRQVPLSMPSKCLHFVLGAVLCGASAIPVWLSGRFGRGGTLVFVAQQINQPNNRQDAVQ